MVARFTTDTFLKIVQDAALGGDVEGLAACKAMLAEVDAFPARINRRFFGVFGAKTSAVGGLHDGVLASLDSENERVDLTFVKGTTRAVVRVERFCTRRVGRLLEIDAAGPREAVEFLRAVTKAWPSFERDFLVPRPARRPSQGGSGVPNALAA